MWLTFFQIQLTKGKEGELQTFPTFGCQVFSQKKPPKLVYQYWGLMDGLVIKNLVLHRAIIVPSTAWSRLNAQFCVIKTVHLAWTILYQ